jgi:hypothetical protein
LLIYENKSSGLKRGLFGDKQNLHTIATTQIIGTIRTQETTQIIAIDHTESGYNYGSLSEKPQEEREEHENFEGKSEVIN